jgi:rhamnulokinase
MNSAHVTAIDLGAGSGRVMDVAFDGEQISLSELHRFRSPPVELPDASYWDALHIWRNILDGLAQRNPQTASIGVDTWGVDFAMLDKNGMLLGNPVYYRDSGRMHAYNDILERFPRREIFDATGIQFMSINSLYQLIWWQMNDSPILDAADTFLTMPDLFHYWLTGVKVNEFTNATTTQMLNPVAGDWDRELLVKLGLPTHFLAPVVRAGEEIGKWNDIPVIVPPTHDTGSAVVAVPTTTKNYAYLSSGTWSLLGLEVPDAIINDESFVGNLTNEGGYNKTIRLLKNIMGLWIIEQTLATWRSNGTDYSYEQVMDMVEAEQDMFAAFIDPDDQRFLPPGDMAARIRDYCQEHGLPVPQTDAAILTTLHVSLALKYRHVLDALESVSGQEVSQLHIIGGGSQNRVLNQMTANAIGRPVYAGPIEATALGNGIVQLITLGEIASLEDARSMLSRTVGVQTYEPQDTAVWEEQYQRYRELIDG